MSKVSILFRLSRCGDGLRSGGSGERDPRQASRGEESEAQVHEMPTPRKTAKRTPAKKSAPKQRLEISDHP